VVGPARADLYWGAGDDAARIAGRIRHPGRFAMLVPRELDMVAAGRHMPLPVPKPKVPELVEVNKHDKGKVDSAADEDRQRQVGARKPPPRDCATGSGIGCGRKSVPSVAFMSKRLPTTGHGPAGGNQQQQHQQQQGKKQQLTQQPQPGVQGRAPHQQLPGTQDREPQQKKQLQATAGRELQRSSNRQPSSATDRNRSGNPATEGRGPRQKLPPQAMERRGPQQKQQPPATEGRGPRQKAATASRDNQPLVKQTSLKQTKRRVEE